MRCTHAAGQPDDSSQRGDAMRPSSSFCIMLRCRSGHACSRLCRFLSHAGVRFEGLNWIDESVHFAPRCRAVLLVGCFPPPLTTESPTTHTTDQHHASLPHSQPRALPMVPCPLFLSYGRVGVITKPTKAQPSQRASDLRSLDTVARPHAVLRHDSARRGQLPRATALARGFVQRGGLGSRR